MPVALTPPALYRGMGSTYTPAQVQAIIVQAAQQQGVPPSIALAVASHESRFQADAQNSTSSAAGVMQLLAGTQQTMGVTNPYDPTQNVDAGVSLLARFYQQYGSWPLALQAYSDGQGTVNAGLPPSQQTIGLINYVNTFDASSILSSLGVDTSSPVNLASLVPSMDQINSVVAGIDLTDPSTIIVGLGLVLGLVWVVREL